MRTDGAACDTVYTVEITPLDNAPAPAQTSVQVKGGGTVYFTGLTFDAPGDYRYKLAQVKGCAADTTYDGRTYTVTVRVMTAADGSLDTELWAVRSGRTAKAAGVVFTNRYDPPVTAATATPAPSAAPMPRPIKSTARPVGALPRTGGCFPAGGTGRAALRGRSGLWHSLEQTQVVYYKEGPGSLQLPGHLLCRGKLTIKGNE